MAGKALLFIPLLLTVFFQANLSARILKNGDFSQKEAGWITATWQKVPGRVVFDGNNTELKTADKKESCYVYQHFDLKPRTKYVISYRMKVAPSGAKGKRGGARIDIYCRKGKKSKNVHGSSPAGIWKSYQDAIDWKRCSFVFRSGDAPRHSLYLSLAQCAGQAWFDDFVIEEKDKQQPTSLVLDPVSWRNSRMTVAEGFPTIVYVLLKADHKKKLGFELELPKGARLVAANPWHPVKMEDGTLGSENDPFKTSMLADGGTVTKISPHSSYREGLKTDKIHWKWYYRLYIDAAQGTSGKAVFRVIQDGKKTGEEFFQIIGLAPLPGIPQKLEKFGIVVSSLYSVLTPGKELRKQQVGFWTDMAVRPMTIPMYQLPLLSEEYKENCKDFAAMYFTVSMNNNFSKWYRAWTKKSGKTLRLSVNAEGKNENIPCPLELASLNCPYWQEFFVEEYTKRLANHPKDTVLMMDYEPGVKKNCFCAECRKAFAKQFKLKTIPAGPGDVLKNHLENWYTFRVAQHAVYLDRFAKTVKNKFPGRKIFLCTDPQYKKNPKGYSEWCGVDCRKNDSSPFDLMMNMFYYEGLEWFDDFKLNCDSMKKRQFPLVDPTEHMKMYVIRYTAQGIFMNMLASAAIEGIGYGIWPGDNLDGEYRHSLVKGANMIAPLEKYYCAGEKLSPERVSITPLNSRKFTIKDGLLAKTVTLPDFSATTRHTLHRTKEGGYLLTVFNYDMDNSLIASVKILELKEKCWQVLRTRTGEVYDSADPAVGFPVEIAPNDVQAFELIPGNGRISGKIIRATSLLQKAKTFQEGNSMVSDFPPVKKGNVSASWGLLPDNSFPLIKLAVGGRSIYIDPRSNAKITAFFADPVTDILADSSSRGVLDELKIARTPNKILKYTLKKLAIENGCPTAVMEIKNPYPEDENTKPGQITGITIEKTVTLKPAGKGILAESFYRIGNPTNHAMTIEGRIHNYPRLGLAWKTEKVLTSFWKLRFRGPAKEEIFTGSAKTANVIMRKSLKAPDGLGEQLMEMTYAGGPVTLEAADRYNKAKLVFSCKEGFSGIFTWWSVSAAATVEPLFRKEELRPGKSITRTTGILYEEKE